jgi:8-oxo-dGTP pyrophosphatase MutT (NUDIX family)
MQILNDINNLIQEASIPFGYRQRVEVIIFREDGKLLQTIIPPYRGINTGSYWGFPGGGIESGDNSITTVKKETLEEVGIALDNIKKIKKADYIMEWKEDKNWNNKTLERAKTFKGSKTEYFTANFKNEDSSLYGNDKDTLEFQWVTIQEAKRNLKKKIKEFEDPKQISIFKARLNALRLINNPPISAA